MRADRHLAAPALLAAALAAGVAAAQQAVVPDLQAGDCVFFREGGDGIVFTTPVYWLKGTVNTVVRERRRVGRCPRIGKPRSAYTPADWAALVAASPCLEGAGRAASVAQQAPASEVEVMRAQVVVEDWETPWSHQHGSTGWLFRGQFLAQPLQRGGVIAMDIAWLQPCETVK